MARLKVISLFSGAGGLDYGFEAAGFDTKVAVEMDGPCCATLRANRSDWSVFERSIFDVSSEEMLEHASAKAGDVDVVIGGPPCQPFSKAGYWARGDSLRLDDPRANTLSAYLRVVEDVRPRAFLLENVQGLAFKGKDEGLQLLMSGLKRINARTKSNYQPHVMVLNAADFGVPQIRERVFVVASRDGRRLTPPIPTHGPDAKGTGPLFGDVAPEPHRTAWDAIGDLPNDKSPDLAVRGKWAGLLPSIPEGQNYLWHTERGGGEPLFGWRRHFWGFLLKLAKAKPSWTLQAQPGPAIGPFHWSNRRLSMRELCRIQTFPDDVNITGTLSQIQKQLGNAVPSLLAEVLARTIRSQLLDSRVRSAELVLLRKRGTKPPRPSRPGPIPDEYLKLAGHHAAHPGTGLGNAALARAAEHQAQ